MINKPNEGDVITKEGVASFELEAFLESITDKVNADVPKQKITTGAPGVSNDSSEGYTFLSVWLNTATGDIYDCTDPAKGAAVWALR